MKIRHAISLFLVAMSPMMMGGYGGDDGCSGDDMNQPTRSITHVADAEESASVPSECLQHIDDALRKAQPRSACDTCQTRVADEAALSELKRELTSVQSELATLKLRKTASVVKKSPRLLKTVTVKPGWWMGRYVKSTSGATNEATRTCNGFKSINPRIHPGQSLKICGW